MARLGLQNVLTSMEGQHIWPLIIAMLLEEPKVLFDGVYIIQSSKVY